MKLNKITQAVEEITGISEEVLISRNAKREVADIRLMFYKIAHDNGIGYTAIGRYLGDRTHSAVFLGKIRCEDYLASDKEFKSTFDSIVELVCF